MSVLTAQGLLMAAHRSIDELRIHGRDPVRIRMHPLDAAVLRRHFLPDAADGPAKILGLDVEEDAELRRGLPVAEWDAGFRLEDA